MVMFEKRNDLVRFLAVVEAGTIAVAADRLAISQPALTRVVARLEKQFGGRLFERLPHGVRLTLLGTNVESLARRVLREIEAAEEVIDAARSGRTGSFRVTASPAWGDTVLPEALARFHDDCPGIEVRLETASRAEGIRQLAAGESDLHCGGIDGGELLHPSLRRERFLDVTAGIVAGRHHPLHTGHIGQDDLLRFPWIDFHDAPPVHGSGRNWPWAGSLHDRLGEATQSRARIVVRTVGGGLSLMRSGPYLAWLPLTLLERVPGQHLQPLPTEIGRCTYRSGCIVRRSAEELRPFRSLVQSVRETALGRQEQRLRPVQHG